MSGSVFDGVHLFTAMMLFEAVCLWPGAHSVRVVGYKAARVKCVYALVIWVCRVAVFRAVFQCVFMDGWRWLLFVSLCWSVRCVCFVCPWCGAVFGIV